MVEARPRCQDFKVIFPSMEKGKEGKALCRVR